MRALPRRVRVSPLAGLFVLLCGGPQATKIKIAPVPRTTNETPAEKSADTLYRGGLKAEASSDWVKASKLFAASAEKNPDRPKIWDSVGFSYEMSRQLDQAILAYERAIEKDPHEQYAYKRLGVVYETLGQYDSATAELQKQLEMNAQDVESHLELANIYVKQRKFDLALSEFQAATQNMSPGPSLDLERGVIQLGLHRDEEALASFRSALDRNTDPLAPGAVALALADEGVHLDTANQLATLALHRAEAASNSVLLATINYESARSTALVASVWDTTGWVWFAQGNMKAAEDYIRASWTIDDNAALTAFHLGEIYAREGRRPEAIRAYALSLSCSERPQCLAWQWRQQLRSRDGQNRPCGTARSLSAQSPTIFGNSGILDFTLLP
jgi:tetratricopeptide (TPR) repeat protein